MKLATLYAGLLAGCCALSSPPAAACGEGQFNMGQGLRYSGYLAPRPATVLIYDERTGDLAAGDATYRGLEKAGHTITVVGDLAALERALGANQFDVVIAKLDRIEAIRADSALAAGPHLLPVVERGARNDPGLKARYKPMLPDGASVAQYLKAINLALAPSAP